MNLLPFLRLNAPFLSAGFLLNFGSAFGQTYFISIFAGQIRGEFDLSHAAWGGIYSLATLFSAAVMIWSGSLTDIFRVRTLGTIVICGLAGACLIMAWSPVWWMLFPTIFLLRLSGQGMMSHLSAVSMTRWFVATRGKALSVASLGYATAEATLPLIFVALLAFADWRFLWVLAAVLAVLLLPILSGLLRKERTPQSIAAELPSAGMQDRHWKRRDMLRHPLFWFLVPALLGPSAFITALFFQQVHIAEIKGWSHLQFVALFPAYTLVSIVSAFGTGFLIDRWGTARMMPYYQLPLAVGFLVLSVADTMIIAGLGMTILGIASGANSTLPSAFWAEFYGTRFIGSIKALGTALVVLGSAIGPVITGVLIGLEVGIEQQFIAMALYFLLTCLVVWTGIRKFRGTLPATL